MGEHVKHMGKRSGTYRLLVGKPEGQSPRGRPRRRWKDNIKMYLQDVRWVGMDWIDLAWDRDRWRALIDVVMNLRVPENTGNFFTSLEQVNFSKRTLLHGVSKQDR